jgi:hypothetical protein
MGRRRTKQSTLVATRTDFTTKRRSLMKNKAAASGPVLRIRTAGIRRTIFMAITATTAATRTALIRTPRAAMCCLL